MIIRNAVRFRQVVKTIMSLFVFFHMLPAGAQVKYFKLSGRVLQAENGAALQSASVQARQTTIGTATDAEGNFTLYLPAGGYEIDISYTGYLAETQRVSSADGDEQRITVSLKPKEKELQAVAVVGSNEVKDGWEKYGSFFTDAFVGKTPNAGKCRILNPEVLKFYFSKKRNRLKVMTEEALLIENRALGYRVRYSMDSFVHEYASGVSQYAGFPMFDTLQPGSSEEAESWRKARELAYDGSILHFMRSVYRKKLAEQGFEVQFLISYNGRDTAIALGNMYGALNYRMDDSTQTVSIRPNQRQVVVIYLDEETPAGYLKESQSDPRDFQLSVMEFTQGHSLFIEPNGFYFEQNNIMLRDYWTWEKVADMLPYDYGME